MAYSPVEIRHIKPPRGVLGYRRKTVDRLFAEIADSFEEVWRGRADHADRVEELEADLQRHTELETLLRTTLTSAERAAHDLRDQATRTADAILEEAHAEARAITREARSRRDQLLLEARRIHVILTSALRTVDAADLEAGEPEVEEAA